MGRRAIVIGSAGQIGRAVVTAFADAGWQVSAIRQTPSRELRERRQSIDEHYLDRLDTSALADVVGGGADALIDTVGFEPEDARQLLSLGSRLACIVTISSASVYCDEAGRSLDEGDAGFPDFAQPISESQSTVAPGTSTYSERKVAMEQLLLHQDVTPVSVLRPCAVHGIGSRHPREWWIIKRILDRRAVLPLAYLGESRFHTSAAANIAHLCRIAAEKYHHGTLNIGDPDPPSVLEIAHAISDVFNYDWALHLIEYASKEGAVGMTPWSVPKPFVLDLSKAAAIGYKAIVRYQDTLPAYCSWLVEAGREDWPRAFPQLASYPASDLFDYDTEDRFLRKQSSTSTVVDLR